MIDAASVGTSERFAVPDKHARGRKKQFVGNRYAEDTEELGEKSTGVP